MTEKFKNKERQNNIEFEEIVFRLNDLTIRVKKDFVRIDTSKFVEGDDCYLDFPNADKVRRICKLLGE